MVGGGDAGGERFETERTRAHRERRRQREAAELQKQIDALDATIERLHKRTKEKAAVLNSITQETMRQIKSICFQRGQQRRDGQLHKRRITRHLFLRQFRNRQYKRKRIRVQMDSTPTNARRTPVKSILGAASLTLAPNDLDEKEALRQWEAAEDLRDNAELVLACRREDEAAVKATTRLRWLKEVTSAQLKHLEEFMKINRPPEDAQQNPVEESLEQKLPVLRAKHCQLVSLLQNYGLASDDRESDRTILPSDSTEHTIPATVALRNLWSDLEEHKLLKLQQSALSLFARAVGQVEPTPCARCRMSPASRQRRMWRHEAAQLLRHGKSITTKSFSYFDFWPVRSSATDEGEESGEEFTHKKNNSHLPEIAQGKVRLEKGNRNFKKPMFSKPSRSLSPAEQKSNGQNVDAF